MLCPRLFSDIPHHLLLLPWVRSLWSISKIMCSGRYVHVSVAALAGTHWNQNYNGVGLNHWATSVHLCVDFCLDKILTSLISLAKGYLAQFSHWSLQESFVSQRLTHHCAGGVLCLSLCLLPSLFPTMMSATLYLTVMSSHVFFSGSLSAISKRRWGCQTLFSELSYQEWKA